MGEREKSSFDNFPQKIIGFIVIVTENNEIKLRVSLQAAASVRAATRSFEKPCLLKQQRPTCPERSTAPGLVVRPRKCSFTADIINNNKSVILKGIVVELKNTTTLAAEDFIRVDLANGDVVTILFGLFQVLLAVPLAYAAPIDQPRFFVLPLIMGILVVAGGSLTMANERNPNRYLLQGSACSNVVSLLGAVIAFCLYCDSLSKIPIQEECRYSYRRDGCMLDYLMFCCKIKVTG
ncbi:hypothetical protein WMY93_006188 [Mugilogobius chulae]|uniref:Uncharacterized protein n=1 Tax=Mugilogobius chulae TaxID=88201 RepID=A0AAW0PYI4_9GOBI